MLELLIVIICFHISIVYLIHHKKRRMDEIAKLQIEKKEHCEILDGIKIIQIKNMIHNWEHENAELDHKVKICCIEYIKKNGCYPSQDYIESCIEK